MKNLLIIAMLLASTAAFADNSVATPGGTPPAAGSGPGGGEGPGKGERFDELKTKILQHIHEREACVQAATNIESLKACHKGEHGGERGERGEGRGGGFGGGRGGQQQGGGAPAPQ